MNTSHLKNLIIRIAWFFLIITVALLYFYPVISCRIWHNQEACEIDKWQQRNLPNS